MVLLQKLGERLIPELAKKSNVRDYATINELTVLSNLESHNAQMIREGMDKKDIYYPRRKCYDIEIYWRNNWRITMLLSISLILIMGMSMGWICQKCKLPSLLGMLVSGIVLGPYVLNLLDDSILGISADLRKIALIIILTRAGTDFDPHLARLFLEAIIYKQQRAYYLTCDFSASILLSSGSTMHSIVMKQILPPMTLETGSARNTPEVPMPRT